MNARANNVQTWRSVRQRLSPGDRMTISKVLAFPHPREAGARPTISWPMGQIADYALDFEIGLAPLFIREFADRYEAVVAGVELAERTLALVESNPRLALCVGGALLGAAFGTAVVRKPEGAALGAAVGALVAMLVSAHLERRGALGDQ
jgi:hypothetical protein